MIPAARIFGWMVCPEPEFVMRFASKHMEDLCTFLCWELGVRSWQCLGDLCEDSYREVCDRVRAHGFGPGHLHALRELRANACANPLMPVLAHVTQPHADASARLTEKAGAATGQLEQLMGTTQDSTLMALLSGALHLARLVQQCPDGVADATAARALDHISEAARLDPALNCRRLQLDMQDVVILCICRRIDPNDEPALKRGLTEAFGRDLSGTNLIARLFNARFQLFGKANGKAKKKNDKKTRRAGQSHHGGVDAGGEHVAHADDDAPEIAGQEHHPTPEFGEDILRASPAQDSLAKLGQWQVRKTFLEWEDGASETSRGKHSVATSVHRAWPKAARHRNASGWPTCTQVDDQLLDMHSNEEQCPEISTTSRRIIDALAVELPPGLPVESTWALVSSNHETLPYLRLSGHDLRVFTGAVYKLAERSKSDEEIFNHCIAGLGTLVASAREFEPEDLLAVTDQLTGLMVECLEKPKVQEACATSLLRVWQGHQVSLGLSMCGKPPPARAHGAILRALPGAMRHESCRSPMRRLLARALAFPEVLRHLGGSDGLEDVLSEVVEGLQWPLTWESWSYDSCGGDVGEHYQRKALLKEVIKQAGNLPADGVLEFMGRWAETPASKDDQNFQGRYTMTRRFKLVGILLASAEVVVRSLLRAVAAHVRDEDVITSAFNALIELWHLGLVTRTESMRVVQEVRDSDFAPQQSACIGAYWGALCQLCAPAVDLPLPLVKEMVEAMAETVDIWLPKHDADSVVYVTLWGLNQILRSLGSETLSALAACCLHVPEKVRKTRIERGHRDVVNAVNEADSLEALLGRTCLDSESKM